MERLFEEIDQLDGEITQEMVARFDDAQLAISAKVDGWIQFLDMAPALIKVLAERKRRITRAHGTAVSVLNRRKEYLKGIMLANPGVPFKGQDGQLYLHGHAETADYTFDTKDTTIRDAVHPNTLKMEPTLGDFVKTITVHVLDTEKIKAHLKSGLPLAWAKLTRGSDVRPKA